MALSTEILFLPASEVAKRIQAKTLSPVDLTTAYLDRSEKLGPKLNAYARLTPEIAMREAEAADKEIKRGHYRGPLHGIPYAAKDLLSVKGLPTTWGAKPYENPVFDYDATVIEHFRRVGAILIGKAAMIELAGCMNYRFESASLQGAAKNPWNTSCWTCGSSSGSGAIVSAGLAGFAIGTETWGSIVCPSAYCGVSGLRPTFGRVSRHGGMVLAWTQDTVGPICRSAEDCALVFNAIYGPDGKDNTIIDVPFNWDANTDARGLRVGYLRSAFEGNVTDDFERGTRLNNQEALRVIRSLGVSVVPFDLPDIPIPAIDFIRYAETAAFFDDVTRSGVLTQVEQGPEKSTRPIEIRSAYFTPAVDFIQANRFRTRVMERMDEAMSGLDLFIGSYQLLTNRTGHPVVSMPSGFHNGLPTALHFTGKIFGDSEILLLANAFQAATRHHQRRPPI